MTETNRRDPASLCVYTDGSCHSDSGAGAWVAIILNGDEKIVLSGQVSDTTHQRMELTAAVKAFETIHTLGKADRRVFLYTDSQYLADLPRRRNKLLSVSLLTKKNVILNNADLILQLFKCLDIFSVELCRVKSHQKVNETVNYNREADKLARKIIRDFVKNTEQNN